MVIVEFQKAKTFKSIIESIKELVKQCKFEFTPDGIFIQAMDSSKTSLLYLQMPPSAFANFQVREATSCGLDLESLSRVIKGVNNESRAQLILDSDVNKIEFLFTEPGDVRISKFVLRTIQINDEDFDVGDVDSDVQIELSSSEFTRIIKDLSVLGDDVKITSRGSEVTFLTQSEIGEAEIKIKNDAAEGTGSVSISTQSDVQNIELSLKYLMSFTKSSALSDTVVLKISNEYPAQIIYPISEGGSLRFFLAQLQGTDEESDEGDSSEDE